MRFITALLALAIAVPLLLQAQAPAATAASAPPVVEPPYPYLRTNLAIVAVQATVRLRLDRGEVNLPAAPPGPESLSFDVQYSRASMLASRPGRWRTVLAGTADRWHQPRIRAGEALCVRARQHSWGQTSAWSERECLVRALDDRAVRTRGGVVRIDDERYEDGRASVLRPGARMSLAGVPRDARYGLVYTDYPVGSPRYCVHPEFYLAGRPHPNGYTGSALSHLVYLYSTARASGTAVYESYARSTCAVGGIVVVPRWAR